MDGNEMQGKAQELQRLAMEVEAEAVSENSAVRVLAGPGGRVKELDLRPNAFQMSGLELGEMIAETVRAAGKQVEAEMNTAVNRILGPQFVGLADDEGGPR
ncbi:hypothetical protein GCM10027447_31860 [Glycomyces halotolerans]